MIEYGDYNGPMDVKDASWGPYHKFVIQENTIALKCDNLDIPELIYLVEEDRATGEIAVVESGPVIGITFGIGTITLWHILPTDNNIALDGTIGSIRLTSIDNFPRVYRLLKNMIAKHPTLQIYAKRSPRWTDVIQGTINKIRAWLCVIIASMKNRTMRTTPDVNFTQSPSSTPDAHIEVIVTIVAQQGGDTTDTTRHVVPYQDPYDKIR